MPRDFEPYEGHYKQEEDKSCICGCCKKFCRHLTKQLWKLFVFIGIYVLCGLGVYWGVNEIISLNNFTEIPDGCTIQSIDTQVSGVPCTECDCNYYYNPFVFDKKRVCTNCDSVKYRYTVTAEHCGTQLLTLDDDYWYDKACGVPLKQVGEKHSCFLYKDCRGQYSFDTMYADQNEIIYPVVIIVISVVLMLLTCLIKCICC